MLNYIKLIALGLVTLLAMIAASYARDLAYQVHAIIIMVVAGGMFLWTLRRTDEPVPAAVLQTSYMDGVVRYGVIANGLGYLYIADQSNGRPPEGRGDRHVGRPRCRSRAFVVVCPP